MADNVVVTAGLGTTIHADEYTHSTLGSGKTQLVKLVDGTLDNSTAIVAGNGTNGGALRVTVASDSTGQVVLAAGTALAGKVGIDQSTANANEVVIKSGTVTTITNAVAVTNAGITTIAAAVSTEMQCDIVGALPAGTALLGKVGIDQATANANEVVVKTGSTTAVTSATGLEVVQNTAADLNCTEASAAAIKTAVELIDNAISGAGFNITQVNGEAIDVGAGTEAAAIRVTLPTDGTGVVKLGAGTAEVGKLAAGTANIGDVGVLSFLNGKTIKRAVISGATSGNNTIVAAVADKKIKVLSVLLIAVTAVTVRFESGADGTALTGVMSLAANAGFVLNAPADPTNHWFETGVNTLLNMELGGAVQVSGAITYYEEA
jgi:hypothetical protein